MIYDDSVNSGVTRSTSRASDSSNSRVPNRPIRASPTFSPITPVAPVAPVAPSYPSNSAVTNRCGATNLSALSLPQNES